MVAAASIPAVRDEIDTPRRRAALFDRLEQKVNKKSTGLPGSAGATMPMQRLAATAQPRVFAFSRRRGTIGAAARCFYQ
jgi:hypothetical protein